MVLNDLDPAVAEAVANEIRGAGGEALAVGGSVTEEGFPEHLMASAAAEFGGGVDILVNNAGFTWDGVLHKMSDKQWQAVMDVHATAPFRLIRAAVVVLRVRQAQVGAAVRVHGAVGRHDVPVLRRVAVRRRVAARVVASIGSSSLHACLSCRSSSPS